MGSIECKIISGKWYAYYVRSYRDPGSKHPKKRVKYIGPVSKNYKGVD